MNPRNKAATLLGALSLGPMVAGVGWLMADATWPEYSTAIGVGLVALLILINGLLLVRARRQPDFAAQLQEQVTKTRSAQRLGPLGRSLCLVLSLVCAAAAVWCAIFLLQAPDFGLLFVPLVLLTGGFAVLFAGAAITGRLGAEAGLLPFP